MHNINYALLLSGIVSTLIGYPIDTVKVLQQVTNNTIEKTVRDIYIQDKASEKKFNLNINSTTKQNLIFIKCNR